jgi:hypothetical protein
MYSTTPQTWGNAQLLRPYRSVRLPAEFLDTTGTLRETTEWATADVIWLLGSICQIHRIPFDPLLVQQQFPLPYTLGSFIEAAGQLGLKVGESDASKGGVTNLRFPLVAIHRQNRQPNEAISAEGHALAANDAESAPELPCLALVLKCDGERVLFFNARASKPETVETKDFFDTSSRSLYSSRPKLSLPAGTTESMS